MSFKDGRIGVGKDPIFPLDISGSCRIDGDLILGGRFSDSSGNPIQLGSGSGATSTPDQSLGGVPSWSSSNMNCTIIDTTNNDISYPLILDHHTSGQPANGIGTGIRFDCQRGSSLAANYQGTCATIAAYGAQNMNTTEDRWNLKFTVRDNDTIRTPMVMKYNGAVGIGTDSPDYDLHIKGSPTPNLRLTYHGGSYTNGTVYTHFDHYSMNVYSNPLNLNNSSTTNIIMGMGGGNVGIGTSSPDHKLELYESTGFVRLCMESSSTGKLLLGTHNDGRVFFWNEKNSYIHFGTNNAERMRIDNVGYVGIATTNPLCGLQVGAEGEDSLISSMKFARFMGAGYRNNFPEGAYNGFSCDNHGTFVMGNNCHIKYNGEITITNSHTSMAGVGICMPGNGQTNQGSILFYTKNPGSVTRGDVAYDIDNGDTSGSGPTLKIDGHGRITHNCNDQYLFAWHRPSHSMWWAHIENSYFTFHLNGVGHCGRFYATGSSSALVFNRAINNNYTEYHTSYSGWGGKLLVGAGPMGTGNDWHLSNACVFVTNGNLHLDNRNGYTTYINHYSSGNLILCDSGGNVGIDTSPSAKLDINGYHTVWSNGAGRRIWSGSTSVDTYSSGNKNLSIHCSHDIRTYGSVYVASDRRIKENIVDVSDNEALNILRNIPCRYYEYIDKFIRGKEKTIGFIAQEVKEYLPLAIGIQSAIIPNELRMLENISWNEIVDASNNKTYKLTTDLQNISGIKYKFFVTNDASGNNTKEKDIIGNDDNTFTFDTAYNYVFCYGKEVDDFHTLDKQKLFALNFSATQELDRKVITLEEKTKDIERLIKENYDQNVKILDLYKENDRLKARLAKIEAFLGI